MVDAPVMQLNQFVMIALLLQTDTGTRKSVIVQIDLP